jgi:glycosyltransferase involved in cell wall biosynthesis
VHAAEQASETPDATTIAYVGQFDLPRGNAAAYRMLGLARALGTDPSFKVSIVNILAESTEPLGTWQGIPYHNTYSGPTTRAKVSAQISASEIIRTLDRFPDLKWVIPYNFPALPLAALIKYCRKRRISCVPDVTEWYGTRYISRLKVIPKWVDTELRMKWLHPRADGLIVISSFLQQYYSDCLVHVVPPLVDINDAKWRHSETDASIDEGYHLVYAGSPSREKEDLDALIRLLASSPALRQKYHLHLVGSTQSKFEQIYPSLQDLPDNVTFHGRVPHETALSHVKQADLSVVMRPINRVTLAGFPTKFVESLACGTPVLATPHPDLDQHLREGRNGVVAEGDVERLLLDFQRGNAAADALAFDYRMHSSATQEFLNRVAERNRLDS